jgi:hypothetical protein
MRRRAHQRAQLRAQQIGVGEAESQAVPFVQIEGPDGDRIRRHALDEAAIQLVLFVFLYRLERPARQHELRSI